MFRNGRRLFSAASLGLVLVGLFHTAGQFVSGPRGAAEQKVIADMSAFRMPMGLGMSPSLWDVFECLSWTMSITLLAIGAANLLAARLDGPEARVVRGLAIVSTVAIGALVLNSFVYRIPPPLVSLGVVEILFVLSLVTTRPAARP